MNYKLTLIVFFTAFVAELGDKSQVLAVLYASSKQASPWLVFVAISLALVCATGLGVFLGHLASGFLNERLLSYISGIGFLLLGAFTLFRASQI